MMLTCSVFLFEGMANFLKNTTFHGILLDALFDESETDMEEVAKLLSHGIVNGAVRPLKTTCFEKDDLQNAFRFMAQGKHIGKVLIKVGFFNIKFVV